MNSRLKSILYSSPYVIVALVFAMSSDTSLSSNGSNSAQTLLAQGQINPNSTSTEQELPQSIFTSAEQQLLTEGNSFEIDNVTFSHHTATINGIQLHYVMGGEGDPVVLLHGWPQTWYEWRHVMPDLAKNYTVIAPDLRGIGDSSKPPTGYDGKTVAEDIHQLVTQLGFNSTYLVGHDIGVLAAYPYAAEYPSEVKKLAVMESLIPGFFPPPTPGTPPVWHIFFHQAPDVPEALIQGQEREYLTWFYRNEAYNPDAITEADIDEYVSHYSAPGAMRAGFEYYRAVPEDTMQNLNYSKTKLTIPVLAMGAGYSPILGGNVSMSAIIYGMQQVAENVTAVKVPNSGHWIPEEQPKFLVEQLTKFFNQ
jgi:pimeloyl-ACP methyl ester carboxylesterase